MSAKDIYEVIAIAFSAVPAWILPQRAVRWLARTLARVNMWARPRQIREGKHIMGNALPEREQEQPTQNIRQIQLDLLTNKFEARYFQPIRAHRPGSWSLKLSLTGREHIEAGLAAGNGVILWVYPFIYYPILTKRALMDIGLPPVHLSRPAHGYSGTRFGVRYLNPVLTSIEDLYISERVVLVEGNEAGALRTLMKRLRENRVVSITANAEGQKVNSVPFLNGELRLAPGAPYFALSTKAVLLPTMTVREQNGDFVVYVEPALRLPSETTVRQDVEVKLTQQFAQVLEAYARRYPEQWPDWQNRLRWSLSL